VNCKFCGEALGDFKGGLLSDAREKVSDNKKA
jgi:hypothetical protein